MDKPTKPRLAPTKNKLKDENDVAPTAKRSRHTLGEHNFDGDHNLSFATPRRNDAVNQLLNRPQVLVQRPVREIFIESTIYVNYNNFLLIFKIDLQSLNRTYRKSTCKLFPRH